MIVQEDIPLTWLFDEKPTKTFWDDYKNPENSIKYHALYCVCDSNFFDHTIFKNDRRAPHTCVYVQAYDVITKSVDVRVPGPMFRFGNQPPLTGDIGLVNEPADEYYGNLCI